MSLATPDTTRRSPSSARGGTPPDLAPLHAPPAGTPWPALLIHGGLTLLWLVLLVRAVLPDGLWSWAAGLLYIAYDTALLLFVFWKTLPLIGGAAGRRAARQRDGADTRRRARPWRSWWRRMTRTPSFAATLTALLEQSDPPDRILVADDGSGDRTVALLSERFGLSRPARRAPRRPQRRSSHAGLAAAAAWRQGPGPQPGHVAARPRRSC